MVGFYFSHEGTWVEGGSSRRYYDTKEMCWEWCLKNNRCVAFTWPEFYYPNLSKNSCTHYYDSTELLSVNEKYENNTKAYIKCSGINDNL